MCHPHRFALAFTTAFLASVAFAQPSFPTPKTYPPDAATLKQIEAKTAELKRAVEGLPKDRPEDVWADVAVYLKAAEWIVRHGEWYQKDSGQQTLRVLDAGLSRAKAAAEGKTPWRDVRGKPVIRGYKSRVDGSVQPVRVNMPAGFSAPDRRWRTDVVLHGRDGTLTEVKFINAAESAKPGAAPPHLLIEPYGRGNNAYRWAGETDVFEAFLSPFSPKNPQDYPGPIDFSQIVLRGFSMGGAGTWHIGLHFPEDFAVIGPGAGFTTTRGYIKNFPAKLPDYVEKCLHIYDAVDYAENASIVPVVAYSGGEDAQKAAADNIEKALKGFSLPIKFTHLVAPGLGHSLPPQWQAKTEAKYSEYLIPAFPPAKTYRIVTYTPQYGQCSPIFALGLERQYEKAIIDVNNSTNPTCIEVTTSNVRVLRSQLPRAGSDSTFKIDGQDIQPLGDDLVKISGKWVKVASDVRRTQLTAKPEKLAGLQGPIDDAFRSPFTVIGPSVPMRESDAENYVKASYSRFAAEWDKWLRGKLPTGERASAHLVLFGDPESNPSIARILPKLPITWTNDKLVVNGVEYDPTTHVPVLIYPLNAYPQQYIVLNSGHTFHDADFRGTNALLYPRLGDWAVLKPTPTKDDPAAAEVVAAGLFDENWQFPKKSK